MLALTRLILNILQSRLTPLYRSYPSVSRIRQYPHCLPPPPHLSFPGPPPPPLLPISIFNCQYFLRLRIIAFSPKECHFMFYSHTKHISSIQIIQHIITNVALLLVFVVVRLSSNLLFITSSSVVLKNNNGLEDSSVILCVASVTSSIGLSLQILVFIPFVERSNTKLERQL